MARSGADHAGAFGQADHAAHAFSQGHFPGDDLGKRVGGHDGPGQGREPLRGQTRPEGGHGLLQAAQRQRQTDDPGGGHENLVFGYGEQGGRLAGQGPGVLKTPVPGAGVGVAAVDQNGPAQAGLDPFLVDQHGSGLHLIPGKNAGRRGGRFGHDQAQVFPIGTFLDMGFGNGA